MVIKPWGMGVWDLLRAELDDRSAKLELQLQLEVQLELQLEVMHIECEGCVFLKRREYE